MRNDLSWIVNIVDRSGSMGSIRQDAIGGFNTFINSQKEVPGSAQVSLVLFDNHYEEVYSNIDLNRVPLLTDGTFVPRGSTSMNDAIGKTIINVGSQIRELPEESRPGKVIVVILTDGMENSSVEYTQQQVADMIKHQREVYNWEFIFLAANIDTQSVAKHLNISLNSSYSFQATSQGTRDGYATLSTAVAMARSS